MSKFNELINKYGFVRLIIRLFCTLLYKIGVLFYKYFIILFHEINLNQIVFYSKPSFSDNAKTLYEYLNNHYNNYRFIWLIGDVQDKRKYPESSNTIFVYANSRFHSGYSIKSIYYLLTSKYIFFTHSFSYGAEIGKRKEQVIINLWHGCGYKSASKKNKSFFDISPFDYGLVPGNVFIDIKRKFWGCSPEIVLPLGYPRYDLLLRSESSAKEYVSLLKGNLSKFIIWMPTFRKAGVGKMIESKINLREGYDFPLMKSERDISLLNSFCLEHNLLLLIKRHPYQVRYMAEDKKFSNIIFICNNDLIERNIDLYSLLRYTDALISDYSSVSIDFLLLNKPIAFSLDDYEQYKNKRGFVFDNPLEYMPGHHLYNFDDLKAFLLDVAEGKDPYAEERKKVMPLVHNSCDNYCERIWNKILELSIEKNV